MQARYFSKQKTPTIHRAQAPEAASSSGQAGKPADLGLNKNGAPTV
jgi:hypothetical protein